MATTNPIRPTGPTDTRRARDSSRRLGPAVSAGRILRVVSTDDDPAPIEIPTAAAPLLLQILDAMQSGRSVSLVISDTELTTKQAADLLGVSRPFIVKQIESGRLAAHKVGTHRRIRAHDLLAYRDQLATERQQALDELSTLDEALGLD